MIATIQEFFLYLLLGVVLAVALPLIVLLFFKWMDYLIGRFG